MPPNPPEESPFHSQPGVEPASALGPEDLPHTEMVVGEVEALEEARGRIRSGKLAGKSMWAAIWILAMPVFLQQTMQACVGLVDKIIAGRLPENIVVPALDGISIGAYISWFIGIAMTGLGVGGQVLIARAMGSGDVAMGHRALGQSMTLSIAWGALVGIVLWFMVGPLATLTKLTPEATLYCTQFVRTIALAMPFTGIMFVGSMCLYGAGETTMPSLIAIGVNIVNIFGSWIFSGIDFNVGGHLVENPFSFDLYVIGIALGYAISQLFGAAATLWVLSRGVKDLKLEGRELPLDRVMFGRILRIGVPSFAEGIAMWLVNLFVMQFIGQIAVREAGNGHGEGGLQGAHLITVQWEALSFLPGFAIGTAAGALAGQYLGAGNARMAQRAILACTAISAMFMSLLGVIFMTQGEFLTRIISDHPVHLEHVPRLLFICGTVQVFFAITIVIRQGLRGAGDARWVLAITTFSTYFVRLPAAYVLGVALGYGLEGIWIALCGELVIRAMLFSARFLQGGWQRIRV